jgi:hypothetical protein
MNSTYFLFFSGMTFLGMQNILKQLKCTILYELFQHTSQAGENFTNWLKESEKNIAFMTIGRNHMTTIFTQFHCALRPIFLKEFQDVEYKSLSWDHTFRFSKKIVTTEPNGRKVQFGAFAIILNERGAVVAFALTSGQSIAELQPLFEEIRERCEPEIIYTGNFVVLSHFSHFHSSVHQ